MLPSYTQLTSQNLSKVAGRYQDNKISHSAMVKAWKRENPEKTREYKRRAYRKNPQSAQNTRLKRDFDITLKIYNEMLCRQEGVCAICRQPERVVFKGKIKALAVDHNHATGEIRGLLCMRCNVEVGIIENKERFSMIHKYLDSFKSER